jgi:hypothetical protein
VFVGETLIGEGAGRSKKTSETDAASVALKELDRGVLGKAKTKAKPKPKTAK